MLQEANDEIERLQLDIRRLEGMTEGKRVGGDEEKDCGHLTQIESLQNEILSLHSELKTMKTASLISEKSKKDLMKVIYN